jgi:nucleoside-diphosphate-sugar epimerase
MKVLITGASGFLGKECSKQFKKNGYSVLTTDITGNVDYKGDLAERKFVLTLPDVDIVLHCAAVQYVTKNLPIFFREYFFQRNNVIATQNLCDRYFFTDSHFINVSTSMIYKQTGAALYGIHSPKGGEGVYSKSKFKAQALVNELPRAATIIPCIIGGEGREGLFRSFVSLMKKHRIVVYPGKGSHPVSMVHVIDVAKLALLIAQKRAYGLFNAAAPRPLSISDWSDEIADELNLKNVKKISIPLRPLHIFSKLFGYRFFAREQLLMLKFPHVLSVNQSNSLGWEPEYNNAQIVRDIARKLASSPN